MISEAKVIAYVEFKMKQFVRCTGFDVKQPNAKEALKAKVAPLLDGWIKEAAVFTR